MCHFALGLTEHEQGKRTDFSILGCTSSFYACNLNDSLIINKRKNFHYHSKKSYQFENIIAIQKEKEMSVHNILEGYNGRNQFLDDRLKRPRKELTDKHLTKLTETIAESLNIFISICKV